jgi:hypothetical protein
VERHVKSCEIFPTLVTVKTTVLPTGTLRRESTNLNSDAFTLILKVAFAAPGHAPPPGAYTPAISERWPYAKGRFSILLPSSVRRKTLNFWENQRQFFSRFPAAPGGPVELSAWPSQLGAAAPKGLAFLRMPDGS